MAAGATVVATGTVVAPDAGSAAGAEPAFESGNAETGYRTLDPTHRSPDVVEQFKRMALLERR